MSAARLDAITVLLVDDSRPVRTVLKTLLKGLGVTRIYEAADPESARAMAFTVRPDIALIDYDLGCMTGVELIQDFRTQKSGPAPSMPLILLAPTWQPHLAEGAREAGADAVLPKPVTARMLGERIAALAALGPTAESGLSTVTARAS